MEKVILKKFLVIFILIFCFLGFSCVSTSQGTGIDSTNETGTDSKDIVIKQETPPPKWILDEGRLALFPDSLYISQIAYGNTAQESMEKAGANISGYIKSSVVSSTSSSYFYNKSENDFTESRQLQTDIQISADNNLYKLEYTNPYYYEDLGLYVCVAFINREQAFNFVKPKLEKARIQFPQAYYRALENTSVLDKIIGIKNAQELLPDFYEVYDFARAMLPDKAKIYEETNLLASESLVKLKELSGTLIRIEGIGDTDLLEKSGVITELANQFSKMGYVVGDSPESNCIAVVEVKAVITQTRETFETYPEIYIRITEDGSEKISYAKKLSKVAGFDKETVIRRTNLALVNEVKTSFVEECF